MRRNYIGLANTLHDPSVAVVNSDGDLLFAEALERPLQNKRAWSCPPDHIMTISSVLREHCEPDADFVVSTPWSNRYPRRNRVFERIYRSFHRAPTEELRRAKVDFLQLANGQRAAMVQATRGLECRLASELSGRQTLIRRNYEHHLTHAAAAACSSPFDEALCLVVDGFGETSSVSAFEYRSGRLRRLSTGAGVSGIADLRRGSVASLGLGGFYSAVTYACGFDWRAGEEWKVMGLASYGEFDRAIYDLLRPMVNVQGLCLRPGRDSAKRESTLREMRRHSNVPATESANLAHTAQVVFTEIYLELVRNLHRIGHSANLVLGGGCALNSVANGRVLEETPFENMYVFCAPADDGNSVGAALLAYREDHPGDVRCTRARTPYLGSTIAPASVEHLRRFSGLASRRFDEARLCEWVAGLLASGKTVGWVQGRAEFGPRALGNRSILADPRRRDVKELLNERIKFREEFRPFAPSVLCEDGPRYFENFQPSPYMERTLRFRPEVMVEVPGVVHVDGTGRLQTVTREENPRFHRLIEAFKDITGVPILLNTSFNVMGKPIIHSVEDAVVVLMTTGLDVLVVGDEVFEKADVAGQDDLVYAEAGLGRGRPAVLT